MCQTAHQIFFKKHQSFQGDLWPLGLQFLADACNDACGTHVVPSSAVRRPEISKFFFQWPPPLVPFQAMACCEKARRGQWDRGGTWDQLEVMTEVEIHIS